MCGQCKRQSNREWAKHPKIKISRIREPIISRGTTLLRFFCQKKKIKKNIPPLAYFLKPKSKILLMQILCIILE